MASFIIRLRWTDSGKKNIDQALQRRQDAMTLLKNSYATIQVNHVDFTIDGKHHIEWYVDGDLPTVKNFAKDMTTPGFVTAKVFSEQEEASYP
jgi:uncharacterized protein with GYD domain